MKQAKVRTKIRYQKHWYVMLHLEPEEVEKNLQQENEQRKKRGSLLLEYFVPYTFLPHAEPDKYAKDARQQAEAAKESNDLRNAMHHFLFIKAGAREIVSLVHRDWNRLSRLHMFFYNSHNGEHITMPEKKMRQFITLCCENLQRFDFGPPVSDIADYDTVVIKDGPLKDAEAKILDVQHTAHGISLTLGLPFFCGEKTLVLKNRSLDDIHLPRTVETLLNDHFVDNIERGLLSIVYHRMKQTASDDGAEPESVVLNRYFHYSYVHMPDQPTHLRFRALMLICATLRLDVTSRQHIAEELEQQLQTNTSITASEKAFLQAALYISTANVDYRTAAKTYWQAHQQANDSVCRLMPLVTRLNKRFFKQHKVICYRS